MKQRKDAQYLSEKLYDWTIYLEHLEFILLELDVNNAHGESQLNRTIYDGLKPLIKL